ncbi:MAG: AEC family transporter [Tissierellales bacterium]|jgi:predicted permease|nr:AEC family transporter [Tissierellales bacterium]
MATEQIFMLFILIGLGVVLQRSKLVSAEFSKGLSTFVLYVSLPALIIKSMNYEFDPELMINSIYLLVSGILFYPLAYIVAKLVGKLLNVGEDKLGVYEFLMIFGNVGFMGYPVMRVLYGEIGIFYAAMFNFSFNLYIWTLGVYLIKKGSGEGVSARLLINPGTLAVSLGFALFGFSIQLPRVLQLVLESVGGTTTPLSMIVIGMILGTSSGFKWIKNWRLILSSVIRLLIIPLLVLGIVWFVPMPSMLKGFILILTGMPSAALAAIFSHKYGADHELASRGILLTTFLSLWTIPFLIYIESIIF